MVQNELSLLFPIALLYLKKRNMMYVYRGSIVRVQMTRTMVYYVSLGIFESLCRSFLRFYCSCCYLRWCLCCSFGCFLSLLCIFSSSNCFLLCFVCFLRCGFFSLRSLLFRILFSYLCIMLCNGNFLFGFCLCNSSICLCFLSFCCSFSFGIFRYGGLSLSRILHSFVDFLIFTGRYCFQNS